jgi:N-acyl-D-aspartate/D-glutamate deacylase
MKMVRRLLLSILATCLFLGSAPARAAGGGPPWDTLIVNARIVDGTGAPWYRGAVAIADGKIAWIGAPTADGLRAKRVIDARDRVLSPGFVDLMAQDTLPYLTDPASAGSKLLQGITLHLSGEGDSPAPQSDATQPDPVMIAGKAYRWRSYADYFAILEHFGVPLNVVHDIGAAQVRRVVMGEQDRKPTPAEMARMKALVDQGMRDGAVGLSTALIYPPGNYQDTQELIELAKVIRPYGGFYSSHMRNESNGVIGAIDEAVAIGKGAGVPVEIYHLKAAGVRNWPLMETALARIAAARRDGIDVTADIYPYVRNGIGLDSFVPPSSYAKGHDAFTRTLADPQVRAALRKVVETDATSWENWYDHVGRDWNNVLITDAALGKDLVGLSVAQAAKLRGKDSWDFVFDAIAAGGLAVAPLSMNEDQKRLALRAPFVMFDTDSSPVSPAVNGTAVHPRAYGTMARVLAKYVRDEQVLTLEDAIRRMTSAPADRLGLHDRGRIAVGLPADLLLFDPERVQDHATFENPAQYSTGMHFVWVNGVVAVEDGKVTGARGGKVLRLWPASGGK